MPFPSFKTQEEIPEGFREMYEEKDGEWVPKGQESDDTTGLKSALDKEREKAKAEEKERKRIAAELAELKAKEKAEKAGITDEQLKKLRQEIREDLEKEYQDKIKDRDTLATEVRSLKLDSQVKSLAAKHGVRAERVDAWWRMFSDRFDLTDDGKPMIKDRPGTDVSKFIADDLKKELPDFYAGTQAAGGGAAGATAKGGGPATTADNVLANPTEALNAARAAQG